MKSSVCPFQRHTGHLSCIQRPRGPGTLYLMSPWCVSSWLNYGAADFCTCVMKRLASPHLSAQNQVHQLMGNTSRPRSNTRQHHVCLTTSSFSSLGISCNWDFLERIYCFCDFTQCLVTTPPLPPPPCMNMLPPLLCTMLHGPFTFPKQRYIPDVSVPPLPLGLGLQRSGAGSSYCLCDFAFFAQHVPLLTHIPTLPQRIGLYLD